MKTMIIDTKKETLKNENFWNNIHFHPTDAVEDIWGREILENVAKDKVAKFVRLYSMFEDVVTEKDGELVYDFTLTDKRFDYMVEKGFNLLVCYNFMPACIAKDKNLIANMPRYKNKTFNFSEPKDYKLWEKVCFDFTKHLLERYGERAKKWYIHCWNEPDHWYWLNNNRGETFDQDKVDGYIKLYNAFYDGVKKACPDIKVGGPSASSNLEFITKVLSAVGNKMDFLSIHTYATGASAINDGESPHVDNILKRAEIIYEISEKAGCPAKEIVIDEWSVSASGFKNMDFCPKIYIRNNEYFSAFYFKMIDKMSKMRREKKIPVSKMLICLSGQHWLKKDFEGYCNFFTLNGFKKPIYNAYTLGAKLFENQIPVDFEDENLGVIATRENEKYALLFYNSIEEIGKENKEELEVEIKGLSGEKDITFYEIDREKANSYTKYLELGSPTYPDQWERELIKQSGELVPETKNVIFEEPGTKLKLNMSSNSVKLALIG